MHHWPVWGLQSTRDSRESQQPAVSRSDRTLQCEWRAHYILYNVSDVLTTSSTMWVTCSLHPLQCEWRVHYILYNVSDVLTTSSTMWVTCSLHPLQCEWRAHYILYNVSDVLTTSSTMWVTCSLHPLQCEWRAHYILYNVSDVLTTSSTMWVTCSLHPLQCEWRVHYILYTSWEHMHWQPTAGPDEWGPDYRRTDGPANGWAVGWVQGQSSGQTDRQTQRQTQTDQCPTTAPFLLINNNVTRADYCTVWLFVWWNKYSMITHVSLLWQVIFFPRTKNIAIL